MSPCFNLEFVQIKLHIQESLQTTIHIHNNVVGAMLKLKLADVTWWQQVQIGLEVRDVLAQDLPDGDLHT